MAGSSSQEVKYAFLSVEQHILPISLYNLSLWAIAGFLGKSSKTIVRDLKIDRRIKLFRFQNYWHYLLTGEVLEFPRVHMSSTGTPDLTFVDALVHTHEGSIIYKGILEEYSLTKTGSGLETITLSNVKRRYLKSDSASRLLFFRKKQNPYYEIPGELFVIRYNMIINLNVTYYKVSKQSL